MRARAGSLTERAILQLGYLRTPPSLTKESGKFIFVCSGNICRSPYAEAVAKLHGVPAVSCGTRTEPGRTADPTAVSEAAERGVDLKEHRTTRWQDVDIQRADVVFAMQLEHAFAVLPRALKQRCPVVLFSSLLLPEFAVIRDPYGKSGKEFQAVFDLIDAGISHLFELQT